MYPRLIHSAPPVSPSDPRGLLKAVTERPAGPSAWEWSQLIRDLTWFSARAAELTDPHNEAERRLLESYSLLIAQRRRRLLRMRRLGAAQARKQEGQPANQAGQ